MDRCGKVYNLKLKNSSEITNFEVINEFIEFVFKYLSLSSNVRQFLDKMRFFSSFLNNLYAKWFCENFAKFDRNDLGFKFTHCVKILRKKTLIGPVISSVCGDFAASSRSNTSSSVSELVHNNDRSNNRRNLS